MTGPSDGSGVEDIASSQFPTASELANYEIAFPGFGERLLAMAEREQIHRHCTQDALAALSKRGQLFGFIIVIAFLIASAVLIGTGHGVEGTIIGSVDIAALAAIFVTGRWK